MQSCFTENGVRMDTERDMSGVGLDIVPLSTGGHKGAAMWFLNVGQVDSWHNQLNDFLTYKKKMDQHAFLNHILLN